MEHDYSKEKSESTSESAQKIVRDWRKNKPKIKRSKTELKDKLESDDHVNFVFCINKQNIKKMIH